MRNQNLFRIAIITLVMLLAGYSNLAYATTDNLEPITTIMDKSQATGNLPAIIDNAGNNRGAGFNGEYVFVASRQNGNHVYYWNVNTPAADPMELNITGVGGGTFTLSDLTVVGNHIFASNMVFVGGEFKVYHWAGTAAQPTVILSYPSAPARLGDAISIVGNPETNALLIASGHGTNNFYVWTIENGTIPSNVPAVYTFTGTGILNANFGRITKVPGEDLYLASGSGFGLLLLDNQMNVLTHVEAAFFPYWSMYPHIFYFNGNRYLAYQHVKNPPAENIFYVLDINDGANALEALQSLAQATFAGRVVYSVSLGTIANGNASVSLDLIKDQLGNVMFMAYSAGNGFLVQKIGDFIPPTLEPIATVMDKSQATGNLPAIIDNSGSNRGAGFNGQHVFVASRQNGNHVYYWDVNNPGAAPLELNITGVGGGTFTLSDLTVVGNHIFASNMVFVGGEFKVYHWNGVSSQPTVLLTYPSAPARLGDAFSIVGNPESQAKLIVSGHGTKNFYVWNIENGQIPNTTPAVFTFPDILNANFGRITQVPGEEELYLASGSGFGLLLLDSQMNIIADVAAGFFPYWSMYPYIFYYQGQRFLAYQHVKNPPAENVMYVLDLNQGATVAAALEIMEQSTFAQKVVHSLNLGTIANGNASVSLDIMNDADGNVWMMAYAAGNGFVVQKYGDAASVLFGDANCDGLVNILDIVVINAYIMGENPEPFCPQNADVNQDGVVNLLDIVGTVNIILGN